MKAPDTPKKEAISFLFNPLIDKNLAKLVIIYLNFLCKKLAKCLQECLLFAYFAFGNNVINESHSRICSTGHDVEVSVLDFKYREKDSEKQTMFLKVSKSSLLESFSKPRFIRTGSVLWRLIHDRVVTKRRLVPVPLSNIDVTMLCSPASTGRP